LSVRSTTVIWNPMTIWDYHLDWNFRYS